jgi:hypothetical protein
VRNAYALRALIHSWGDNRGQISSWASARPDPCPRQASFHGRFISGASSAVAARLRVDLVRQGRLRCPGFAFGIRAMRDRRSYQAPRPLLSPPPCSACGPGRPFPAFEHPNSSLDREKQATLGSREGLALLYTGSGPAPSPSFPEFHPNFMLMRASPSKWIFSGSWACGLLYLSPNPKMADASHSRLCSRELQEGIKEGRRRRLP